MAQKLTDQEINNRLIRLRNLEQLYPRLQEENQRLKAEVKELRIIVQTQAQIIEKLKLQIEELQKMVFGKKKKKKDKDKNQPDSEEEESSNETKKPRPPSTYRRPPPKDEEITDKTYFDLPSCPDCGGILEKLKSIIRYVEDIRLPKGLRNFLKKVEKQHITTGYCPHCQKRVTAKPIQNQTVSIGDNLREFVVYGNIILRLSFAQISGLINDLANIQLSDGEISNILEQQAKQLLPHYETLKANIRGQPGAHFDETTYRVQKEEQGKYAWVMTGTETTDTVFKLGQSRGKGNAEQLKGKKNKEQVGITDDYGAYRKLFKKQKHQLCWAHLIRKLRDLSESDKLKEQKRSHCQKVYKSVKTIYEQIKDVLEKEFNLKERKQIKQKLLKQVEKIAVAHSKDPDKLQRIKKSLYKNQDKYFTCLLHPDIPTTNNKAERALRHLVLKRRISRGSKTQKGADVMSVLHSVLLSLWWRRPKNFFQEYALLLNNQA